MERDGEIERGFVLESAFAILVCVCVLRWKLMYLLCVYSHIGVYYLNVYSGYSITLQDLLDTENFGLDF